MKTLYYTLVYPYFHYCNISANNYPSRLTRIEILQKRAVRTIAKIQYRDSTVKFFKELKILKIKEINEMSLFMFKLYNNQIPINLTGVFSVNSQIHSYGTRHADDCHLPRKSSRLGQYSLAYQGPKIRNSIENKTRKTKSFYVFNKNIKEI